jgi:hypothetical protein
MNQNDRRIDAALESYPVYPAPPGFSHRVMEQIRLERNLRRAFQFRLDFIDLALPIFFAFFASLGLGILLWLISLVDAHWLVLLQLELRNIFWVLPAFPGWLALVFAGLGLVALVTGLLAAFLFMKPGNMDLSSR